MLALTPESQLLVLASGILEELGDFDLLVDGVERVLEPRSDPGRASIEDPRIRIERVQYVFELSRARHGLAQVLEINAAV